MRPLGERAGMAIGNGRAHDEPTLRVRVTSKPTVASRSWNPDSGRAHWRQAEFGSRRGARRSDSEHSSRLNAC
jgi:hypothetical protein